MIDSKRTIRKRVYKLFGFIPVWSIIEPLDINDFYDEVTKRFSAEMVEKLLKMKTVK